MLEAVYQLDTKDFLSFLSGRGFYIAEKSNSNYGQTTLSLSSSLNLDYVDAITLEFDPQSKDLSSIVQAIHDSKVRRSLTALGYTTIAFETGYPATEIQSAEYYLSPPGSPRNPAKAFLEFSDLGRLSAFEAMFLQSSALRLVTDPTSRCLVEKLEGDGTLKAVEEDQTGFHRSWIKDPCLAINWLQEGLQHPYQEHRDRILYVFEKLTDLPIVEGPRFVIAHLVVPHFPYVFGPDGENNENFDVFSLRELDLQVEDRDKFIEGYRDQVIFVNSQIRVVIEKIIAEADTPPVIILQGDHGPNLRPIVFEPSGVPPEKIRFGILNAYYWPDCSMEALYETISPVNSFRVLFNSCFGGEFDLLPDHSYYSNYDDPLQFIEVTEILMRK